MMDIITPREAFIAGKIRYFTGEPCKNGHVAERQVSNGVCVVCAYAHGKAWRATHRETRNEEARRYRQKHPDKVAAKAKRFRTKHRDRLLPEEAAKARIRRALNPETQKRIEERGKAKRVATQEAIAGRRRPSTCDICGPLAMGRIVFDHSHAHQGFRGWLCDRCNRSLGQVKDNPKILRAMVRYLERDFQRCEATAEAVEPKGPVPLLERLFDDGEAHIQGAQLSP